jgi:hypothetical protein
MLITREQAKVDLTKVMAALCMPDDDLGRKRGAQIILGHISAIDGRLNKPNLIRLLDTENPNSTRILPDGILSVVSSYVGEKISKDTVKDELDNAYIRYSITFTYIGIKLDDNYLI